MRISDWSSDVCSSDLPADGVGIRAGRRAVAVEDHGAAQIRRLEDRLAFGDHAEQGNREDLEHVVDREHLLPADPARVVARYEQMLAYRLLVALGPPGLAGKDAQDPVAVAHRGHFRSDEHTYELQSLMRNSHALLC